MFCHNPWSNMRFFLLQIVMNKKLSVLRQIFMVENSCCLLRKWGEWLCCMIGPGETGPGLPCNATQCNTFVFVYLCICVFVYLCICVFVYLRICCVFVYFHDSHLWNWTLSCDVTHLKNCNNFWLGHLFDLNTGSIFEEEIAFWIFADQRSSCCLSATSVCSLPPYPPRRSSSTQAALLGLVLYTGKSSTASK